MFGPGNAQLPVPNNADEGFASSHIFQMMVCLWKKVEIIAELDTFMPDLMVFLSAIFPGWLPVHAGCLGLDAIGGNFAFFGMGWKSR